MNNSESFESNNGINQTAENTVTVDSIRFPCPGCGADMKFSADKGALVCKYCNNLIDIEDMSSEPDEYSITDAEENADYNWDIEKRIIKCDNCGAKTILEKNITGMVCPFCDSSQVVLQEDEKVIHPESLVPFKISDKKSMELFKNWISKKIFAPNKLKKELRIKPLKGIYIPYWTYDSDTSTAYIAKKGTYYYTTHTRTVNGRTVTTRTRHTRWTTVRGIYGRYYNDVIICASNTIDNKLEKKLGIFYLEGLKKYKPEYLAGFITERYGINLNDGWQKAKDIIDNEIYQGIRRQVKGDEFRLLSRTTSYGDVKYKHLLLPIWNSSFKYKDKTYQFVVNGQTGTISGSYPKSILKILIASLAAIIPILVILNYLNH